MRIFFQPVRAGGLACFRILFGMVMLWEVCRYVDRGWIHRYWRDPIFNFSYEGFSWIEPLPADGMVLLFVLMGLLSLFIIAGFLYRVSAILLFFLFTYTFLLEQARYLNHFYLVILIGFIMAVVPANRTFSIDSWLRPEVKRQWIPQWPLLLLRFQIGLVYFMGGIAKLNRDWLSGSPLVIWLGRRDDFPLAGSYFSIPEVSLFISYTGLMIDLLAFPLLLYRKTRPWIAVLLVLFHFTNDRLFSIGIFPWLMAGSLILFLPASWPGQIYNYIRGGTAYRNGFLAAVSLAGGFIACWFHEGFSLVPFVCGFTVAGILTWDFRMSPEDVRTLRRPPEFSASARLTAAGLVLWGLIQVTVPLRHYAIPGNPGWTEEGHRIAWRMKLRTKSCTTEFYTINPDFGEKEKIRTEGYLKNWQERKMSSRPQLIVQFARRLSSIHNRQPVFADAVCSLNAGPERKLIDPDVDLTRVQFRDWKRNDWILVYGRRP
ncbi:MAG: HTTM domain-containing protein [Balneolaceae bacterium]